MGHRGYIGCGERGEARGPLRGIEVAAQRLAGEPRGASWPLVGPLAGEVLIFVCVGHGSLVSPSLFLSRGSASLHLSQQPPSSLEW